MHKDWSEEKLKAVEELRKHYRHENMYRRSELFLFEIPLYRRHLMFYRAQAIFELMRDLKIMWEDLGRYFDEDEKKELYEKEFQRIIGNLCVYLCEFFSLDDLDTEFRHNLEDVVELYEKEFGYELIRDYKFFSGELLDFSRIKLNPVNLEILFDDMSMYQRTVSDDCFGNLKDFFFIQHRIKDLPESMHFFFYETLEYVGLYKYHAACWSLRRILDKICCVMLKKDRTELKSDLAELFKKKIISEAQFHMFNYVRVIGNAAVHPSSDLEIFNHDPKDIVKVATQYALDMVEKNKEKFESL